MPLLPSPLQLFDGLNVPQPSSNAAAPVTNRPGKPLYTTTAGAANQGGVVLLGSDYAATPNAQAPKVDAYGTQYVTTATPAGYAAMVYTGQAPPATSLQYGTLMFMRQDTPSPAAYAPLTADMSGNLYVHPRSKSTMRAIIRQVATAQNKYLAVLVNGSTSTMVLRLYEVRVYITPSGTGGNLLGIGSGQAYLPLFCELYRVPASAVSGGTAVTPICCDSADTVPSAISVLSSPAISSFTASLYRCDVVLANAVGSNFYERRDPNEKSLVVRPGEGLGLICLSSGTVINSTGSTTANSPVDVQLVFTQAPA